MQDSDGTRYVFDDVLSHVPALHFRSTFAFAMVKAVVAHSHLYEPILQDTYVVDVEVLPPQFPYEDSVWEYDDRGIRVAKESGSVWCKVFEPGSENSIAYAVFAADRSVVRCDDVHVDAAHRMHGIAGQLYQLAACLFQAPVVPSGRLLEGGELFWQNREKVVCPPGVIMQSPRRQ